MSDMPTYEFVDEANTYIDQLNLIADFLIDHQGFAPKIGKNIAFNSADYWKKISEKYLQGRVPKKPKEPSTVPDEMVSVILEKYFSAESINREEIKRNHSLSMAAEGMVGDILERYLAKALEGGGWVWCAGSVVNKIDFIKLTETTPKKYFALQIKNRDNSENSSSASVREGTEIEKWFRTFSKTGSTNWDAFPDESLKTSLSEDDFKIFAETYISDIKTKD